MSWTTAVCAAVLAVTWLAALTVNGDLYLFSRSDELADHVLYNSLLNLSLSLFAYKHVVSSSLTPTFSLSNKLSSQQHNQTHKRTSKRTPATHTTSYTSSPT